MQLFLYFLTLPTLAMIPEQQEMTRFNTPNLFEETIFTHIIPSNWWPSINKLLPAFSSGHLHQIQSKLFELVMKFSNDFVKQMEFIHSLQLELETVLNELDGLLQGSSSKSKVVVKIPMKITHLKMLINHLNTAKNEDLLMLIISQHDLHYFVMESVNLFCIPSAGLERIKSWNYTQNNT